MELLTKTSEATARMETHEVVGYLLERLGRTLTAYIANSRSRSMPARWATPAGEPNHASPSDDKATRLKAAHSLFRSIESEESDQVARNWLISANPRLGGHTPADLLRDDRFPEVFAAATAFMTDNYYA